MKLSDRALVSLRDCLIRSARVTNDIAAILRSDAASAGALALRLQDHALALDKSTRATTKCVEILRSKPRPRLNGNGGRKSGTR